MKIIVIMTVLMFVCAGVFFLIDDDKKWVMFNSSDAESYAMELLNNSTIETPAKFIDYSVSASDGFVTFSKHYDHSTIYGYFPSKPPSEIGGMASKLNWEPLGEQWFVSHL